MASVGHRVLSKMGLGGGKTQLQLNYVPHITFQKCPGGGYYPTSNHCGQNTAHSMIHMSFIHCFPLSYISHCTVCAISLS